MTITLKSSSHKCPSCGQEFTFDQIYSSVKNYGFINLLSEKKEILALNCPDRDCFKIVQCHLCPGQLEDIISEFTDVLAPSGYERENKFCYFSAMPFTYESYGIWNSYNVSELDYDELRDDDLGVPTKDRFTEGYYSFCPNSESHSAINSRYRLWFYPENSVLGLLALESNTRIPLFPRYFPNYKLFKLLDRFAYPNRLKPEHLSDKIRYQIPSLSTSETGVVQKKLTRKLPHQPITPYFEKMATADFGGPGGLLYNLLSENYIQNNPYENIGNSLDVEEVLETYNDMLNEVNPHFHEGSLNRILNKLVPVFIKDYSNYFRQNAFGYRSLWLFKHKFLKILYDACLAKKIFITNLTPSSTKIVTEMCRVAAMEHWYYNPKMTRKSVVQTTEIQMIMKEFNISEKTMLEWLNNLKPKKDEYEDQDRPVRTII